MFVLEGVFKGLGACYPGQVLSGAQLLGAMVLLYLGAEWLVGGASQLALALRVRQLVIGLTVVAWGTSTPEIIVGIQAAITGHPDVALGNVIGSNIANIGLILGLASLISPSQVAGALRGREPPVLLGTTVVVPLLLINGRIDPLEARALIVAAVAYTWWLIRSSGRLPVSGEMTHTEVTAAAAQALGAPKTRGPVASGAIALAGLAVLVIGGRLFVEGAVDVARMVGMSERVVGLTIVAVGTSLPELVTSVVAAVRGHSDIAVGNVVGSNIFNALMCLGTAGLAGPVGAPLSSLVVDLAALGVMTVLAIVFMRTARRIARAEGVILLILFAIYTAVTITRG